MNKLYSIFMLLLIIVTAACESSPIPALTPNAVAFVKVTEKTPMPHPKSPYYLVYTPNEVFMIADAPSRMMFNSSDVYNQIHPNKCYKFSVYGYRSNVISQYRRIIKAQEQPCEF